MGFWTSCLTVTSGKQHKFKYTHWSILVSISSRRMRCCSINRFLQGLTRTKSVNISRTTRSGRYSLFAFDPYARNKPRGKTLQSTGWPHLTRICTAALLALAVCVPDQSLFKSRKHARTCTLRVCIGFQPGPYVAMRKVHKRLRTGGRKVLGSRHASDNAAANSIKN